MNLDRGLIKSQAKELIKGKVMKLFLTVFVIQCIVLIPNIINAVVSKPQYENFFEIYGSYFDDAFDDEFNNYQFEDDGDYNPYADDFENFGTDNNSGKSDFYNFGTSFVPTSAKAETAPQKAMINAAAANIISFLMFIAQILLMPLAVTLLYFFVLFIRGKEYSGTDGLKFIFKESFTNNCGNKIGVALLRELILAGLGIISMFIFFIPMFIFYYSSYFAFEIQCDNPQLSPWQAIKLSKKMIKGNRTELFVLDLSFIPWELLCVFLFPAIYVIPYIQTTRALYYENFRIRALQQGRISEDDFLTDYQRMQKYAAQNNAAGYQTGTNGYQQNAYQQNPYNPQQPNGNAQQTNYQGAYQPNGNAYQYNAGTYQEVTNEQSGSCDASHVETPPFYTMPQMNTEPTVNTAPTAEPVPTADPAGFGIPDEPQTTSGSAENTEPAAQNEPLKPSEKYTPVTPPSENYTPTEDTNE